MTHWRIAIVAMLAFSILPATGMAAPNDSSADRRLFAKCKAQLRKCNSHCNLVYERGLANRTCRDRCKDTLYVCEAKPR